MNLQTCDLEHGTANTKQLPRRTRTLPEQARSRRQHGGFHRSVPTCRCHQDLFVGLDFGTSGARAHVIQNGGKLEADFRQEYKEGGELDWADAWQTALWQLLKRLDSVDKSRIGALAIDGTSSTCMLVNQDTLEVVSAPQLYNATQLTSSVQAVKEIAPPGHTATASTSALCKMMTWHNTGTWQKAEVERKRPCLLHQADWLAALLHGQTRHSDWNNALKLGFDPALPGYPPWLMSQPYAGMLPRHVHAPGEAIATITAEAAARTGLPADCLICAGTTDSNAAFIAAGVTQPGEAVTSLGSTLAVKLLSETRVDRAEYGIYSHRLGDAWLVGGASNTGGAVLKQFFSSAKLKELSARIDASSPSPLQYYPLTCPGERFPINDPALEPCMEPRPQGDADFLHGLLEGIARVEAQAYGRLEELGATHLTKVVTAGGGAANEAWTNIRSRVLGVPVIASPHGEAAHGAALLAQQGFHEHRRLHAHTTCLNPRGGGGIL
ncbi:hypothetical protein WJX84_004162 [Apatococcus fuscideae]|uniref:D-ribulose kinase n=1 Tax=Apatococcus fuscideae TaxID=2026836 RepID=A0AAW1S4Q2_9CHLO